jgi:hypothetical protein
MAKKVKGGAMGAQTRDEFILSGSIVIGAAGAIASTTGLCPSAAAGVSPGVVKTAGKTGRYTVTLDAKYITLRFLGAPGLVGPADAAIATADEAYYRNRTTQTFDIQTCLAGVRTDADPASGTEIHWAVVVRDL